MIGAPAVPALGLVIMDDQMNPFSRSEAAETLERMGREAVAAMPILEKVVEQDTLLCPLGLLSKANYRYIAAWALLEIGGKTKKPVSKLAKQLGEQWRKKLEMEKAKKKERLKKFAMPTVSTGTSPVSRTSSLSKTSLTTGSSSISSSSATSQWSPRGTSSVQEPSGSLSKEQIERIRKATRAVIEKQKPSIKRTATVGTASSSSVPDPSQEYELMCTPEELQESLHPPSPQEMLEKAKRKAEREE